MSLPLPTRCQQNPYLPTQGDNHKRLQMLPLVPWGTKLPSVENYVSLPLTASCCWEEEGVCWNRPTDTFCLAREMVLEICC